MNLKKILNLGASLIGTAYPPLGAAIKTVNAFLPKDKQLPENATGEDVERSMEGMNPDMKADLMGKEIDLEIQEVKSHENIQIALAKSDETGSSTRPNIAYMMAWCVCSQVIAVVLCISLAAYGKTEGLAVLKDCWPMLVASIGTPTVLLKTYFGLRTEEKAIRQAVANGHPPPISPLGILGKLLK